MEIILFYKNTPRKILEMETILGYALFYFLLEIGMRYQYQVKDKKYFFSKTPTHEKVLKIKLLGLVRYLIF